MNEKLSASRNAVDVMRTHAERLALDAEERQHQRLHALAEQTSVANPPNVRIRAWEKAHGLRMPGDAAHLVLDVIAHGTGLTLEQIREEQRARAAARAERSAGPRSGEAAGSSSSDPKSDTQTS